jgi:hypothetical protein
VSLTSIESEGAAAWMVPKMSYYLEVYKEVVSGEAYILII